MEHRPDELWRIVLPWRISLAENDLERALEKHGHLTAGDVIDTAKAWTTSDVGRWNALTDPDGLELADYDKIVERLHEHAQALESRPGTET